MRKSILIVLITIIFLLVSCEDKLSDLVFREFKDPFPEKVKTESVYSSTPFVRISWSEDKNADEYLLYRAADSATPVFKLIYKGEDLSFEDPTVSDNVKYLYRLNKKRGDKEFVFDVYGGSYILSGTTVHTNYTEDKAIHLYSSEANTISDATYLYNGKTERQKHWYKIKVPSNFKARYKITQTVPTGVTTGGDTNLKYFIKDESSTETIIKQDENIEIINSGNIDKDIYFYITSDNSLTDAISIYSYVITFQEIVRWKKY